VIQIVAISIQDNGTVDVQVRGSSLSVQGYGRAIGVAVRIAADMFSQASEGQATAKEATREILKEINKAAYGTEPLSVHSASVN